MKLKLCLLLRNIFLLDYFDLIVTVFDRDSIGSNRDLCIFSKEFDILNSFEFFANNYSKAVFGRVKGSFKLFSRFLLNWLI